MRRAIISNVLHKTKFRMFHLTCDKTKTRLKSMGALGCNINFLIPILREKEFEIVSYVMGCHDYKNIWKLPMKEKLETRMEPDNIMDNFTVTVVRQ